MVVTRLSEKSGGLKRIVMVVVVVVDVAAVVVGSVDMICRLRLLLFLLYMCVCDVFVVFSCTDTMLPELVSHEAKGVLLKEEEESLLL